jgi:hypothetical protein
MATLTPNLLPKASIRDTIEAMKITTSLDWEATRSEIMSQIHRLDYNADLRKMVKSIDAMVDDLSKLEVEARRINKTTRTQPQVDLINKSIETLDQFITMAALLNGE